MSVYFCNNVDEQIVHTFNTGIEISMLYQHNFRFFKRKFTILKAIEISKSIGVDF